MVKKLVPLKAYRRLRAKVEQAYSLKQVREEAHARFMHRHRVIYKTMRDLESAQRDFRFQLALPLAESSQSTVDDEDLMSPVRPIFERVESYLTVPVKICRGIPGTILPYKGSLFRLVRKLPAQVD